MEIVAFTGRKSGTKKLMAMAAVATIAISPARGDTYTVAEGETQTLDSVTNTTRFTKSGKGTLVVTGTNSLTSLTSSGGTLNFHGGETTISGAGSSGAYGDAAFVNTCSLAGDYTIVGNTNGCGCVKFNQNQDVSNLSLAFADVEKMDSHARSSHYKIVDAPNGITGTFALAADWPMNWSVKYADDRKSVYVYHQNGTQLIFR